MELNEIKSMWRAYDAKLEKTLRLNQRFLEMIQAQKVKSRLTPLFWQRVVEFAFHMSAVLLLIGFLYKNFYQFQYAVSAILLIAFYMVAFLNA